MEYPSSGGLCRKEGDDRERIQREIGILFFIFARLVSIHLNDIILVRYISIGTQMDIDKGAFFGR